MTIEVRLLKLFCAVVVACMCEVEASSSAFAAEPVHPLLAGSQKLGPALLGTREHAEQCAVSRDSNFAARLDVAEEQPLVLRVGVECIGSFKSFESFHGNVWLDPEFSIGMAVAAFEPVKESLEGHLLQPVNTAKAIESSNKIYLLNGVSVGRLVRVTPGPLSPGISPMLPLGEHILQLSVSARVRGDSQLERDLARQQPVADVLDTLHCRSEPCRVRVTLRNETIAPQPNAQPTAESPLKCILRPLGPLPRKVGDPVTFELILENNSEVSHILDASVLACGTGFNGIVWLTKEVEGNPASHFNLILPGGVRFNKRSRGDAVGHWWRPCTHQLKLPPDCFVASKLHIPKWEIPGEFSLQVIYNRSVFNPGKDISKKQPVAPKSNILRFTVIERE